MCIKKGIEAVAPIPHRSKLRQARVVLLSGSLCELIAKLFARLAADKLDQEPPGHQLRVFRLIVVASPILAKDNTQQHQELGAPAFCRMRRRRIHLLYQGLRFRHVSNQRPSLVSGQIHASLHLARKRLVIQLATFCYSPNFGKPKYLGIEGARAVILFENLLFQFEQFRTVLGRRRHGRYREGTGADGTGGRVEILIRRGSVRQKMQ